MRRAAASGFFAFLVLLIVKLPLHDFLEGLALIFGAKDDLGLVIRVGMHGKREQEDVPGNEILFLLQEGRCPSAVWAVRVGKLDDRILAAADLYRLIERERFCLGGKQLSPAGLGDVLRIFSDHIPQYDIAGVGHEVDDIGTTGDLIEALCLSGPDSIEGDIRKYLLERFLD